MALGIPTVATNLGCNDRIIKNNVSGLLVTSMEEWKQAIISLINDPLLRQNIGKEARKMVEQNYSVKANRNTYLNIFNTNYISKQLNSI